MIAAAAAGIEDLKDPNFSRHPQCPRAILNKQSCDILIKFQILCFYFECRRQGHSKMSGKQKKVRRKEGTASPSVCCLSVVGGRDDESINHYG